MSEPAQELARVLREAATALVEREIDPRELEAAAARARELLRHLEGPRRPRWYEVDAASPTEGPAGRAYGDHSPLRGRLNALAPPLRLVHATRPDGSRFIEGWAQLSSLYEGPPHGVHGGVVAALFDEVLGAVMGLFPPPGVTATLEVKYRQITPLERELHFEGWVEEERGRRVVARARCQADGQLTAEARGTFLRVDFESVRARMRGDSG